MKRREAIKNTALFFGSVSILSSSGMLASCQPSVKDDWMPEFFTENEVQLIDELAETIIPRTDTPGAKDAMVGRYLDQYAKRFLKAKEQELFKQYLTAFEGVAGGLHQKSFIDLDEEQRASVFNKMIGDMEGGDLAPDRIFYEFRRLVNRAFFTSEVGATQVLHHQPIPGNYDGDIPLSDTKGLVYSG